MGFLDIFSKKTEAKASYGIPTTNSTEKKSAIEILTEALKGFVTSNKIKFPTELGEEHPFDYEKLNKLCKKYGVANAIINKHVEFIFAAGINIECKDERGKVIIEQWMKDVGFLQIAKKWVKAGLKYGFSCLELGLSNDNISEIKVLKSKSIYVNKDDLGYIENYKQYVKDLDSWNNISLKTEVVTFEEYEVAVLNFNEHDDDPYGYGLIYPLLCILDDYMGARSELHKLNKRKANAPLIMAGGDVAKGTFPSTPEIAKMKEAMENMRNEHDWAISKLWEPKVIDFGNFGDKFSYMIENDLDTLYMAAEIPAFLMGKASIPEGVVDQQMTAFLYKIQAMREDIEKVIEEKIFKRILLANGFDFHVEIVWGLPSQKEKNEKVTSLNTVMLNPYITQELRYEIEKQIAINLDIDPDDIETEQDERDTEEEEEKLPKVPKEDESIVATEESIPLPIENQCGCGKIHTEDSKDKPYTEDSKDKPYTEKDACHIGSDDKSLEAVRDLTMKEWVGFNYQEYNDDVMSYLKKYDFEHLVANTKTQIKAGLFTSKEIESLRLSLMDAMEKNMTIRELEDLMNKRIAIKDRLRIKNNKLVLNKNGKPIVSVRKGLRPNMIARTEVVRASSGGQLENYRKNGVEEVRHAATLSERTCSICMERNGKVYPIESAPVIPDSTHVNCRCTYLPAFKK